MVPRSVSQYPLEAQDIVVFTDVLLAWGEDGGYDDGADIEYEESMVRAESELTGVRRMARL